MCGWDRCVCVFVCICARGPCKAWMCDIRDHGYDRKEGVCVCVRVRVCVCVCKRQGEMRGWALCLRPSKGYVWQGKVCACHPRGGCGGVTHE